MKPRLWMDRRFGGWVCGIPDEPSINWGWGVTAREAYNHWYCVRY